MTAMRYPVCFVILTLMLGAVSCGNNQNTNQGVVPQQGFIALKEFSVTSESTGLRTYAKGTVYVKENEGENEGYHAEILAWVEIDPSDWGGVGVSIPCGWKVASITSADAYLVDNTSVWSTSCGGSSEWFQRVSIVWGGTGTIIIDLDSTSSEENPWPGVLKINVGVGSDERDGIRILNPDYQVIEIPLD